MRLAAEQHMAVPLDEHDRDRVDPGEMLDRAARAGPRPAAANEVCLVPATGAEAMARMPAGEAQCSGEQRCVAISKTGNEGQHAKCGARRIGQAREAWSGAVEAEED